MSEVGLTETVHNGKGSDARKFELWLQGERRCADSCCQCSPSLRTGRHEVWVLQAPSRDVKETWIAEVKRVLLSQFHQLKGQTQQAPRPSLSGSAAAVAAIAHKTIQHSSSIPSGAPSSPYGPKYVRSVSFFDSRSTYPNRSGRCGPRRPARRGSTAPARGAGAAAAAAGRAAPATGARSRRRAPRAAPRPPAACRARPPSTRTTAGAPTSPSATRTWPSPISATSRCYQPAARSLA